MKLQSILLVLLMTFTRAMHNGQGGSTPEESTDEGDNNGGSFINGGDGST